MQVNVLGTMYTINYYDYNDKPCFKERNIGGYHDSVDAEIAILRMKTHPDFADETDEYCRKEEKLALRHEIVHAFLAESGLSESSLQYCNGWAKNEEMVDWIAFQFPKMLKAFIETDCMPDDYMSTATLTRELAKREGVESVTIPPHESFSHKAEGPAIVLTVID